MEHGCSLLCRLCELDNVQGGDGLVFIGVPIPKSVGIYTLITSIEFFMYFTQWPLSEDQRSTVLTALWGLAIWITHTGVSGSVTWRPTDSPTPVVFPRELTFE